MSMSNQCGHIIIFTAIKVYAASPGFFIAFYNLWPCHSKCAQLVYSMKEYCSVKKGDLSMVENQELYLRFFEVLGFFI